MRSRHRNGWATLRSLVSLAVIVAIHYCLFGTLAVLQVHGQPNWIPQGPAPIKTSDSIKEFSGCIEAILVDPTVRDRAFVGAVNGGIWRTLNLTASSPTWVPLADQMGSLSIADIEFSPLDLNYETL